jgi:peptide deformylase
MDLIESSNPILHEKTKPVEKFDKELLILVENLFQYLEGLEGVGLAAVQVGVPTCVAVLEYTRQEKDEKEMQSIPKTVLINPKITWKGKDQDIKIEACFSLPKFECKVPRYKKIHLEYFDEVGKRHKLKAKGFLARVIQHEIDHLDGKLINEYLK